VRRPPAAGRRRLRARVRAEPKAFLGAGHVTAGELISTRLLSPLRCKAFYKITERTRERHDRQIRNIAIHRARRPWQDTLVDQLLRQSGTFRENEKVANA